jgi:hypothetical protein
VVDMGDDGDIAYRLAHSFPILGFGPALRTPVRSSLDQPCPVLNAGASHQGIENTADCRTRRQSLF